MLEGKLTFKTIRAKVTVLFLWSCRRQISAALPEINQESRDLLIPPLNRVYKLGLSSNNLLFSLNNAAATIIISHMLFPKIAMNRLWWAVQDILSDCFLIQQIFKGQTCCGGNLCRCFWQTVNVTTVRTFSLFVYSMPLPLAVKGIKTSGEASALKTRGHLHMNYNHEPRLINKETFLAVSSLPPKCRLIFKLIKEDGLQMQFEVAQLLEISVKQ